MNSYIFVSFKAPSHWKSCNYISAELGRLYKEKFPDARFLDTEETASLMELAPGSTLVLYDHRWLSKETLAAIKEKKARPDRVVVYLYGDFTIRMPDFEGLLAAFYPVPLSFVVASSAQAGLVAELYPAIEPLIQICPYPIDQGFARPRPRVPAPGVKRLGFVGRLHSQKGIVPLLKAYHKLSQVHPGKYSLRILGTNDGDGFLQLKGKKQDGRTTAAVTKIINRWPTGTSMPELIQAPRDVDHLREFYANTDLLISPSTFHDEDYGLVIAEAMSQGTPCLLTPWGGYKDHLSFFPAYIRPLKISLGREGYEVDEADLLKAIINDSSSPRPPLWRPGKLPDLKGPAAKVRPGGCRWQERILARPDFLADAEGNLDNDFYRRMYRAYVDQD